MHKKGDTMTTKAGKRLLAFHRDSGCGVWQDVMAQDIAAIEAEAVAAERAWIAAEYRKLRGYPPSGPRSADEVLGIIERRGRHWDGVLRPAIVPRS